MEEVGNCKMIYAGVYMKLHKILEFKLFTTSFLYYFTEKR